MLWCQERLTFILFFLNLRSSKRKSPILAQSKYAPLLKSPWTSPKVKHTYQEYIVRRRGQLSVNQTFKGVSLYLQLGPSPGWCGSISSSNLTTGILLTLSLGFTRKPSVNGLDQTLSKYTLRTLIPRSHLILLHYAVHMFITSFNCSGRVHKNEETSGPVVYIQ